jgi:hypothetical protein
VIAAATPPTRPSSPRARILRGVTGHARWSSVLGRLAERSVHELRFKPTRIRHTDPASTREGRTRSPPPSVASIAPRFRPLFPGFSVFPPLVFPGLSLVSGWFTSGSGCSVDCGSAPLSPRACRRSSWVRDGVPQPPPGPFFLLMGRRGPLAKPDGRAQGHRDRALLELVSPETVPD